MNGPLLQAVVAFLILPGTVAFLVPVLLLAPGGPASFVMPVGLVPLITGIALLLWCVRTFYVVGRGTAAPWAPPRALVTAGPYRLSRNPMYVAVLLILASWAVGFRSWPLTLYALAVPVAFHLRVLLHEEPWLDRTFGPAWQDYKAQVRRWLGRRRTADHPNTSSV